MRSAEVDEHPLAEIPQAIAKKLPSNSKDKQNSELKETSSPQPDPMSCNSGSSLKINTTSIHHQALLRFPSSLTAETSHSKYHTAKHSCTDLMTQFTRKISAYCFFSVVFSSLPVTMIPAIFAVGQLLRGNFHGKYLIVIIIQCQLPKVFLHCVHLFGDLGGFFFYLMINAN